MSDDRQPSFSQIEWQEFSEKLEVKQIIKSELVPKGSETLQIWRDELYKLQGKIIGVENNVISYQNSNNKNIAGSPVSSIEVEGRDYYGTELYRICHCYVGDSTRNITNLDSEPKANFEIQLKPYRVEKMTNIDMKAEWLIEWYINGACGNFIFSRLTERQVKEEFFKKRYDVEEKSFLGVKKSEHTRDYAFIKLENLSFVIQAVPKYLGPQWSNNISIEYREEWGGIPEESQREAISEIVSFILGKQLLNVGYSTFNNEGYPINEIAKDPWGNNIVSKCKQPALFPIMIDDYNNWGYFEKILEILIPQYLEMREGLNLKQALWDYWVSLELPIGVNLPILSSGIEAISKGWFKTSKSKSKGVYMPKKDYEATLSDELKIIHDKFENNIYRERILNKIKSAYNMGVNERINFFFSEIGLSIGDIEKQAIKARNSMAHGDLMNEEEVEKMIRLTRSYQALFHRIILKILGYDGTYIDYSTVGWPERHIDKPLGCV